MVTVGCANCGQEIWKALRDVRAHKRRGRQDYFCGPECSKEYKRSTSRGTRIAYLNCPNCHRRFVKPDFYVKGVRKRFGSAARIFCCAECAHISRRGAGPGRTLSTFVCEACGKEFTRETTQVKNNIRQGKPIRFCSRECKSTIPLNSKKGLRKDLGHMARSTWEANVCRVLQAMHIPYEYEPRAFGLESSVYIPDLRVAGSYWIEVKGFMRPHSAAKLDEFRMRFPGETLVLVDRAMYRAIEREWASRIPEWEFPPSEQYKAA
jgi:YHS domain-containing protein